MNRVLRPSPHLRAHVDCYWTWSPGPGDPAPRRVLPDGCMDLIIDLDAARPFVVGTMTRALVIAPLGRLLGVRFHPARMPELLDVGADAARDARLRLGEAFARDLAQQVAAEPTLRGQVRALERGLSARVAAARAPHASVVRAVELLGATPTLRIDLVAAQAGLGERQLERLFHRRVGVGPKAFARIMRFRRAVERLQACRALEPWALLSLDCGYYDQAHLAREFKALAGVTPGALLREMSDPSKTPGAAPPTVVDGGST